MSGYGQWAVFYASQKARNGLAPRVLTGTALNSLYPSSTWPELAFPAGTTFAGLSEFNYDYNYYALPHQVTKVIKGKKVTVTVYRQHWEDSASNGDGQLPLDGNILGR